MGFEFIEALDEERWIVPREAANREPFPIRCHGETGLEAHKERVARRKPDLETRGARRRMSRRAQKPSGGGAEHRGGEDYGRPEPGTP